MKSLLNKKINTLFLLAILFFANSIAYSKDEDIPAIPNPPRLVNDFANIISSENEERLEEKLVAYNDSTSSQITIVTINSLEGNEIRDFGYRLATKWAIGQKGKDNGILILVAKDDRQISIEVGTGLEGNVTDYSCKHIRDELMIPAFKQSNYYKGLDDAVDRLFALMTGSFQPSESDYAANNDELPTWAIALILLIVIIFILYASKHNNNGGYTGGSGGWISTGGSSWSGGGSSSGGFGGFGGGGFSGGGSSGSW